MAGACYPQMCIFEATVKLVTFHQHSPVHIISYGRTMSYTDLPCELFNPLLLSLHL